MEIYKPFGIVAFVAGWLAIILVVTLWERDKSKSISHHSAANKQAYTLTIILETISLVGFALFTVGWIAPRHDLPLIFSICCLLASVGLIIAAWIPVNGRFSKIHDYCAWGAAFLFVPITLILAGSSSLSTPARILCILTPATLLFLLILFRTNSEAKKYHLYIESLYILVFDIAIIAAGYL